VTAAEPRGTGLETALWRAVAVYRGLALCYAAVVIAMNSGGYAHPLGGWAVLAVMAGWTGYASFAFGPAAFASGGPGRRGRALAAADLAVAAGCVLATAWVETPANIAAGRPTLPVSWVAAAVLAWAVVGGRRAGIAAAAVLAAANLLVHALAGESGGIGGTTFNGIVLLFLAGLVVGHVVRLAREAEARLARAVELEAATRERERLARRIHDSVLQVLAMVQRRGGRARPPRGRAGGGAALPRRRGPGGAARGRPRRRDGPARAADRARLHLRDGLDARHGGAAAGARRRGGRGGGGGGPGQRPAALRRRGPRVGPAGGR
jgi:hypothetical protein